MIITDEQIRAACRMYDLDPVGRVPIEPDGGSDVPAPGPLGFAPGHLSPGWKYLRDLCDVVAGDHIGTDWFAAFTYDQARDHLWETAEDRARLETWMYALVCVGDLGVHEVTEDASNQIADLSGDLGAPKVSALAWDLLSYAGYLVLREVFAPQIDSKPKG